jgi:hypothetical protein
MSYSPAGTVVAGFRPLLFESELQGCPGRGQRSESIAAFSRHISFAKSSHRDNLPQESPIEAEPLPVARFSETVTIMTLKSAMQDLQERTLRAVSGLLGKLDYLASLRSQDGLYSHWGMERVHGEEATRRALRDAHRSIVSNILRTPLRHLVRDAEESAAVKQTHASELLQSLREHPAQVAPAGPGVGTERHLSSVLHALLRLVRNRQ